MPGSNCLETTCQLSVRGAGGDAVAVEHVGPFVELPPNDEKPRMRVALAPEAAALLAALEPEDRLAYAIAFYAGLRRSELLVRALVVALRD